MRKLYSYSVCLKLKKVMLNFVTYKAVKYCDARSYISYALIVYFKKSNLYSPVKSDYKVPSLTYMSLLQMPISFLLVKKNQQSVGRHIHPGEPHV